MRRLMIAFIVFIFLLICVAAQPPLVYRTFLPDTRPSSIAVGFDDHVSFVFDPVRGGISYVWSGPFLDLEPTWTGKIIQPATILGQVFFRDATEYPLRKGDPEHDSEFHFGGYEVSSNSVTFFYQVQGSNVRQTVKPLSREKGEGLQIDFEVADPTDHYWLLLSPQPNARVRSADAQKRDGRLLFEGKETFTVEIRHE